MMALSLWIGVMARKNYFTLLVMTILSSTALATMVLLRQISLPSPTTDQMKENKMKAIVWSKYHCPYCDQAKALLKQKGIAFEEKKIGDGYTKEELLEAVPNARTVPQIFLDGQLIGGFTELKTKLTESK
jgi:glutaredoxin